ncbi:DUF58 domain-containing protein [Aurantimonas sp. 22II-16-19i]|uniref:DUF58 domain-containing protein n=1 Tax=Aurantimonas sp. 22II-16-19i TaxID=1317114 RepID=UPI0009F7F336|nr:DUF58 domain-containing protein [Aurantimonas sp. 22II-16-19i]ORE97637.1 hypothetical protein ATO4_08460 [Aurantimonas sp. 22II-16-19i]
MRPSRLLLLIAGLIALASLALVVLPGAPAEVIPAVWAALGLAVLADAVLTPGRRRFILEAPATREMFVGDAATLDFRLAATKGTGRGPGSSVVRIAWPAGLAGPPQFVLHPGGHVSSAQVTVEARRRGDFALGEAAVMRRSRLRLLDIVAAYPCPTRLVVVPNVRAITSGEIDVQIATEAFGSRAALVRGEGSEFHQLRDFVAGMDSRTIDYKRSARHGALVAREMRAEKNHNIVLALDNGHLMREEIAGLAKIDHMINAALALGWAGIQGGDLVGLYAFDARPRLYLPPNGGRRAFAQLRARAAGLSYRAIETNHTLAMTHLGQRLSRRCLVVVFSDFVDTTTAELLVENVAVLNRHHVMVFVSIRDPLLAGYRHRAAGNLGDVAGAVAAAGLERERRLVLERLARLGVFVVDTDPGGITARLVSTYLTIKARELI